MIYIYYIVYVYIKYYITGVGELKDYADLNYFSVVTLFGSDLLPLNHFMLLRFIEVMNVQRLGHRYHWTLQK